MPEQRLGRNGDLKIWIEEKRLRRSALTGQWTSEPTKHETVEFIAQPNGIFMGRPYSWWSGVSDTLISINGGAGNDGLGRQRRSEAQWQRQFRISSSEPLHVAHPTPVTRVGALANRFDSPRRTPVGVLSESDR